MDTKAASRQGTDGMGCRHCQFDKVRTVFGIHKGDGILSWCSLSVPYLTVSMGDAFWVSELRIEAVVEAIIEVTELVVLNVFNTIILLIH